MAPKKRQTEVEVIAEIKTRSGELGYSFNRGWPTVFLLIDKSNGRTVASLPTLQEMADLLERIEPAAIQEPIEPSYVPDEIIPPPGSALPYIPGCANGYGAACHCQLKDFLFCAFCDHRSGCLGLCSACFGNLKIWGRDYSERSILHTQEHQDDGTFEQAKANPHLISHKWRTMALTDGKAQREHAFKDLIGFNIRPIGSGWTIVNKDGVVLGYGTDSEELTRQFLMEE